MASRNVNLSQDDQTQPPPPRQPQIVTKPSLLQLSSQDQPPQSSSPTTYGATSIDTLSKEQLPKSPSPRSGRHPIYRGIRIRSGKWVSEIREPRKTNRIWLGTYPTPEMAAAAYDVAALALKGPEAVVNFPESSASYPKPTSTSPSHIQAAAAMAAAARAPPKPENEPKQEVGGAETASSSMEAGPIGEEGIGGSGSQGQEYFIDEEELLNMPSLLVDMAGGMLVSPPRIELSSPSSDDSPSHLSDAETLWSYK